jgi:integration host factor subunit alpha
MMQGSRDVKPARGDADMNDASQSPKVLLPTIETPTLTKAELSEMLFERLGLNKRESKDMVEAFFESVQGSLVDGTDVKLSGFGNFQIRRKAPRPGRNPRTGEAIPIDARNVVTFHASQKLKDMVQGDVPAEGELE